MKIQINSLQALERLIGEDKELEIAIKDAIINKFATNYLKGVAHSTVIETLKNAIIKEIDNSLAELVKRTSSWGSASYEAKPELRTAIQREMRNTLDSMIKEEVTKQMEDVHNKVKERLGYALDVVCCKVAETNIDRLVKERISQRLGL